MNRISSAFAVAVVALTGASAVPASAQPAPTASWSGFYVGAHVGAGFRTGDGFQATDFNNYNAPFDPIVGPVSGGMAFGAEAGYHHLFGKRFVAGGEFAIGKLGYSGTGVSKTHGGDTSAETRGGMYWTGLGQAGYAFGSVLPYFAMGLVVTSHDVSILDDCVAVPCGPGTVTASGSDVSDIEIAWGVGLEYALNKRALNKRWTVKVEWLNSNVRVGAVARQPDVPALSGFTWGFTTQVPKSVVRGMVSIYIK